EGFFYGDRTRIELPPVQTEFLKALRATGKPLLFVNCSGSAIAMPWEAENLPEFTDYSMSNRTYRYFKGKPLFAFGHGLSYTQFKYGPTQLDRTQAGMDDTIHVNLNVTNTGARDGDEVVQVYFRHVKSAVPQPLEALCGFQRVPVPHQQSARVDIQVP